jgi:antitoxin VapB
MVLSIKSAEADRLARELAAATGESMTEATVIALRERLERHRAHQGPTKAQRLERLVSEFRTLPVLDLRSPEQILEYDEHGLPR